MRFLMTNLAVAASRRLSTTVLAVSIAGRLAIEQPQLRYFTSSATWKERRNRVTTARALAVTVVAMGAALASPSYAKTSASASPDLSKEIEVLTHKGISHTRASEALTVQAEVGSAQLIGKLEAALDRNFAGVWFEPAEARFHIGVTSRASRRVAQRVVAQTGLPAIVVYTPVRSTWFGLLAAQSHWHIRLARLLASNEAVMGLDAQRNALSIRLSSLASLRERLALKRQAANASVNVIVEMAPLGLARGASCKTPFATENAYCEKTLVSGVSIRTPGECTAGPLLIEGKATYMLTAGHCFGSKQEAGTQITTKVTSQYIAGSQLEIGKEGIWFEGLARDIAAVKISANFFTEPLPDPVPALMAEWSVKPATPHTVSGVEANAKGQANCHVGQTSGEWCGLIGNLNVEAVGTDHLVEDSACGENGDSGGPFFAREKTTNNVLMQGVLVVVNTLKKCSAGGKETYYEPMLDLTGAQGLGVLSTFSTKQLLTTANEIRADGFLWSGALPGLVLALPRNSQVFVLEPGLSVECQSFRGHGILSKGTAMTSKEMTLTGNYTNCIAAGVFAASVSPTEWLLNADGSVAVAGKPLIITIPGAGCSIKINNGSPNDILKTVKYLNLPQDILTDFEITKLTSLSSNEPCGPAGVEKPAGTYQGILLVYVDGGTIRWGS